MAISITTALHRDMEALAYRVDGLEVFPAALSAAPPADATPLTTEFSFLLPRGGYLQLPGLGWISIEDAGLYRVHHFPSGKAVQWIVYDDDLTRLAASCSSIFYHLPNEPMPEPGSADDARTHHMRYSVQAAANGKVAGVCLTAANFFGLICRWLSKKAVVWEMDNLSTGLKPFNTHAMTEAYDEATGKAVLYDVDRGFMFLDPAGEALSFPAFVQRYTDGDPVQPTRFNAKPYGGYGESGRYKTHQDFVVDLYELGGDGVAQDFYRTLGQSEILIGTRSHGDADLVTTSVGRDRAAAALANPALRVPEPATKVLNKIVGLPVVDGYEDEA